MLQLQFVSIQRIGSWYFELFTFPIFIELQLNAIVARSSNQNANFNYTRKLSKSQISQNSTTIIRRIDEIDPWSKLIDQKSRKATFEIELQTNPLNSLAHLAFEMDITSTEFLIFDIFE